jgi:hypothetical protein
VFQLSSWADLLRLCHRPFRVSVPPLIGAGVILVIGLVWARLLRHRRREPALVAEH